MPQLDVTTYTSQLFWLFICFSFLYLTLKYQIIPKLEQIRQNRWNHIEGAQEEAELLKKNAITITKQCKTSIKKAKNIALEEIENINKKSKLQIDKERAEFIKKNIEKINNFKEKIKKEELKAETMILKKINSLIINSVIKASKEAIDKNTIEKTLNNKYFSNYSKF